MRIRAIVIKKQTANEYDQIFTCFTQEFGKINAIAKSILKKTSLQSMHLDVLNLVEFELVDGKSLPIIASAHSEKEFLNVKDSLSLSAAAGFFMDLVDKAVFENQRDDELWDFLNNLLSRLNEASDKNLPAVFREEQRKFLEISGYNPQTEQCALCLTKVGVGQDGDWALSLDMGSLICRNCFLVTNQGLLLKKNDLDVLRNLNTEKEEILHKKSLDLIFESLIGKKVHSLDFLFRVAKSNI